MIACNIAPGLSRMGGSYHGHHDVGGGGIYTKHQRPPCTHWKGFGDKGEWTDLVADATRRANAGMEAIQKRTAVAAILNLTDEEWESLKALREADGVGMSEGASTDENGNYWGIGDRERDNRGHN